MDNPLAGSSDSEDSDGSMFDFTDSEDASSDDGGEPEPMAAISGRIVTSPMESLAP